MGGSEHWVARTRPARGAVGDLGRTRDPEVLARHLVDAASTPGGHAESVCRPRTEAEVATVLRDARRVLVVGAQSSLTGGATPQGDTVLSTARMADVRAWRDDAVIAGPGLVLRTLLDEAAARGRWYPPVPTFDGATLGGTVATNAAGAATFKHGTTRAWVRALTVVLASGEVLDLRRGDVTARDDGCFEIVDTTGGRVRVAWPRIRMPAVPKQSAGYYAAPGMDLVDLFVGAEGTLGVVTEVEVGLVPRPAWLSVLVFVHDDAAALTLTTGLRRASLATRAAVDPSGLDVAAIEWMDARCLALLRADGIDARARVPIPAGAGAAVLLDVELPPGTAAAAVADELARVDDAAADGPVVRLGRALAAAGVLGSAVAALPGEEHRRAALAALREGVPEAVNRRIREAQRDVDGRISKAACDVIVPWERFAESLARYRAIATAAGLDHAVWGHVSDGNVHPNLLPRTGAEMARAEAAVLALGQAAIDLGGCPMSEHGTGRSPIKQELLRRLYGDAGVAAMRAVKRALDPAGIFAPGVLFPA